MIDMYFYETDVLTPTQLNQIETKLEQAKANLITMGFGIPAYQKTTWSLTSYLLAKYLINIENALKEIADIKGTDIETRTWSLNGKESFSYKDLNRWIKAYNLAYQELGQYYLASFTNFTTIENIKSKKLINLQLYGNIEQNGTPTPTTPVPINVVTGRQEIEVRGSRNICLTDFSDWESGQYDGTGKRTDSTRRIRIKKLLAVNPNTTYYFNTNYNPYKFVLRTYDNLGNFVRSVGAINNETTITTSATEYYFGITMYNSQSEASASYEVFEQLFEDGSIKPFICLNSETDKSYIPYNGKTYEINLGKNLFDGTYTNAVIGGTTGTIFAFASNTRTAIVKVEPNTTYTIKKYQGTGLGNRLTISEYPTIITTSQTEMGTNSRLFNNGSATQATVTTSSTGNYLYVYVTQDETSIPELQIEKDSQATPYSPYKTPIELCKIDTYQDSIKKATGKNLFDKTNTTTGRLDTLGAIYYDANYFTSTFIKVLPNTKYVKNSPTADAYHRVCFYSSASEGDFISRSQDNTFTTPANCQYLRFCGLQTEVNTTSLNKGDTVLPYEPYGTDWYIEKQIGKVILKGGNDEGWSYNSSNAVFVSSDFVDYIRTGFIPYSNYYVGQDITGYGQLNDNSIAFLRSTTYNSLVIKNTSITQNTTGIKNWLSANNTIAYYVLATPTYTKIEDEELINQLENIETLKPLMNITIDAKDIDFSQVKFEYFK